MASPGTAVCGPSSSSSTKATRMRFSTSELVAGLGAGLELGQTDTISFICVVIALYLVRKCTELFCLNVWEELNNQGALSVSIAPKFTGGPVLLAGWRAEHGTQLRLALADK
jgi:hypothetical protein